MGRSENKIRADQNEESLPSLPPELILEILSRLPLKHLSQAQAVSKEWQANTHGRYFMKKQSARSPVIYHWYNEYLVDTTRSNTSDDKKVDSFRFMDGRDGVLILMNTTSMKFILWNPAIFRVLELPSPRAGLIGLALLYVAATLDYRVVSVYKDKNSAGRVGCDVLTPGPSMFWKRLAFPDVPIQGQILMIPAGGDVHCVFVTKDDDDSGESGVQKIVTLDVEVESFTVNYPCGVFKHVGTSALNWDGKLGLAKIVGETLELTKLEDYKKQKWDAEKTVIPLPFLKKQGFEGTIRPLFNRRGDIWFWLEGKEIFSYTIETGKLVHVKKAKALCFESEQIYSYRPSLLSFDGMQPDTDTDLEFYRPSMLSNSS